MSRLLPERSPGVTWCAFGDGLVLHDDRRAEIHLLNASGAVVWAACDGTTHVDDLVAEVVDATGLDASAVRDDILGCLAELEAVGAVGRGFVPPPVVLPPAEPVGDGHPEVLLRVVDVDVHVRADHPVVLDHISSCFRWLVAEASGGPQRYAFVSGDPGGPLRVLAPGHDQVVQGLAGLDEVLPSVVNRAVAQASRLLALHAAALRRPDGAVVVLAGASGAGKSTLAGALVGAGWDYLTDEAVGIAPDLVAVGYPKPLALDAGSRALLGLPSDPSPVADLAALRSSAVGLAGRVGPVSAVLLPSRGPVAAGTLSEPLPAAEAVSELAGCAIGLGRVPDALGVLAALAANVPVRRLAYEGLEDGVLAASM